MNFDRLKGRVDSMRPDAMPRQVLTDWIRNDVPHPTIHRWVEIGDAIMARCWDHAERKNKIRKQSKRADNRETTGIDRSSTWVRNDAIAKAGEFAVARLWNLDEPRCPELKRSDFDLRLPDGTTIDVKTSAALCPGIQWREWQPWKATILVSVRASQHEDRFRIQGWIPRRRALELLEAHYNEKHDLGYYVPWTSLILGWTPDGIVGREAA